MKQTTSTAARESGSALAQMAQRLPLSDAHFRRISQLIYQRAGIVLAAHKREMVYNRLVRRLRLLGIHDFGDYLALLESDPHSAEWQAFINALTTNLTAFFREAHHFPILAEHARSRPGNYSVWSTAASTGEEPYSIAITLGDALGERAGSCQVWASDIDTQVLEKAEAGIYRHEDLRTLTPIQMQRYFLRGTGPHQGLVRVRQELAARVNFQPLNLLAAEWALPGPFDAIFCRNVMIYFDKPTQERILRRFVPLLKPGGAVVCRSLREFQPDQPGFLPAWTDRVWADQGEVMSKIRVLCVDDSALMRQLMTEIVNGHADMEMVAVAPDPLVARDLIKKFNPQVLTLDVEMPRMDGLDFLEKLMRLRPMPVVMVSSLTGKGSEITLRALELGAVDFVTKPQLGIREGMLAYSELIGEKIRTAARARLPQRANDQPPAILSHGPLLSSEKLIAIGASTGGTEAIRQVLQPLPATSPALLITQHMPPGFTRSFAERLNKLCQITVKEAEEGERVLPGHAYIAPGDRHLELARSGANYQVKLHDGPAVNRHRPSVDVLFRSVARHAGRNAVGVILTGMGNDGAQGMLEMHRAGAYTLAQSEASCVVFGMPREAIASGGVNEVVELERMSQRMLAQIAGGQALRI